MRRLMVWRRGARRASDDAMMEDACAARGPRRASSAHDARRRHQDIARRHFAMAERIFAASSREKNHHAVGANLMTGEFT